MRVQLDERINELGKRPTTLRTADVADAELDSRDAAARAQPPATNNEWQRICSWVARAVDIARPETTLKIG